MKVRVVHRPIDVDLVRRDLAAVEKKYGVPSERMAECFTDADGVFHETDAWRQWNTLYVLAKRLEQRHGDR